MSKKQPEEWVATPVPLMNCIVITVGGRMFPHAEVTTPTAAPQPLTDLEHQRAALIADAPAMLRALLDILNNAPGARANAQKLVLAHT